MQKLGEISCEQRKMLYSRTPQGQAVRDSFLRGSVIIFVCAGCPGKRFIYELAKKWGIHSVIIDNHDSWSSALESEGVITKFIGVDMALDAESVYERAIREISSLAQKPNGICTFVELAVELTSRLGQYFGVPHSKPLAVASARNKFTTRKVLEAAGLPHVKNVLINDPSDLHAASEYIGYPAVLKPVSGAASLGVQKVEDESQLTTVYADVIETLSGLVVSSGALEQRTAGGISAQKILNFSILMEEYITGTEVDVDVLISEGICQYIEVVDNGPTYEPFFAETWANLPSLLEESSVLSIKETALKSVLALGFTDGILHVEMKYCPIKGPRIIEVNARMGGGPTRKIHKIVSGIDLVKEQLLIAIGVPSRPVVPEKPLMHVGYAFINCRKTGIAPDPSFMKNYEQRDHVVWVHPYVEKGAYVSGPADGYPTWVGDLVVMHAEGQVAQKIAENLELEISRDFAQRTTDSAVKQRPQSNCV